MGEVLNLPTQEDIQTIQTAIQVFLKTRNAMTRNTMHNVIKWIMTRHRIKHMYVDDLKLSLSPSGWVSFVPKQSTEGTQCPICKEMMYRSDSKVTILCVLAERGYTHIVVYGCGNCYSLFKKVEENVD